MADQFDRASDLEELERLSLLALHEKRRAASPESTGSCLYCGEPLEGDLRWCDSECRDDWERLNKWQK